MLKKTITYTDYNGNERTEDFYFNLSKAELTEWDFLENGGLVDKFTKISNAKDMAEIYKAFKSVLQKAYGVKSDDGKRFMKSDELFRAFEESEAYSELIMDLLSNEQKALDFVNGLANIKDIEKALENKQKQEA